MTEDGSGTFDVFVFGNEHQGTLNVSQVRRLPPVYTKEILKRAKENLLPVRLAFQLGGGTS
jgi:hypothetical protein